MMKKHIWFLLAILVLSLIGSQAMFKGEVMTGHDVNYVLRLAQLNECIKTGQLPPRWAPDLDRGYGLAFFNFYPPLFYYLAWLPYHFSNLDLVDSVNFTCWLLFFLSGLAMYLFVMHIWGRWAGLVASTAYMFAPYHLVDVYVRGAVAEFAAFVWMPLILWAVYKLNTDKKLKYVVFTGLSYAFLILSHSLTAMLFSAVIVGYMFMLDFPLFFKDYNRRDRKKLLTYNTLSLALGWMLSAYFWLPAMFEKKFTQIAKVYEGYFKFQDHFVYPFQLLSTKWGYGGSFPGTKDLMSYQIGLMHICFILITLYVLWKRKIKDQKVNILFPLGLVFASLIFTNQLSQPIWEAISLLKFVQFPWRFLTFIVLGSSILSTSIFVLLKNRSKTIKIVNSVIVIGLIVGVNFSYCKPMNYYTGISDDYFTREALLKTASTGSDIGEYRPIWLKNLPEKPAKERIEVIEGELKVITQDIKSDQYKFDITALQESKVRVNTYFFPGWKVFIDREEVEINYDNKYSLIEFIVPQGEHSIKVSFENTAIRSVAEFFTLIGIFGVLVLLFLSFNFSSNALTGKIRKYYLRFKTKDITAGILFLSIITLFMVLTSLKKANSDIWWHLKTGEVILREHIFPRRDIYSFTAYGRPWILHEWLTEIFFYKVFLLFSFKGLVILKSLLITLSVYILIKISRLNKNHTPFITVSLLFLMAFSSWSRFIIRPHLVTYICLPLYIYIMHLYKYKDKNYLYFLPLIQVVWTNMHGGAIVGLALLGVFSFGEFLNHKFSKTNLDYKLLLRITGFTILCSMVSPIGYKGISYIFEYTKTDIFLKTVHEWQSPFSETYKGYGFVNFFKVWLVLAIASFALRIRKIDFTDKILTVLFLYFACKSERYIGISMLVLVPVVDRNISNFIADLPLKFKTYISQSQLMLKILLSVIIILSVVNIAVNGIKKGPKNILNKIEWNIGQGIPKKGVDYILRNNISKDLWNAYDFGGYLIWRFYPNRKVFLDGRNDVYGAELHSKFFNLNPQKLSAIIRDYDIKAFLAKYGEGRGLYQYLLSNNCVLVYFDDRAMVYLKADVEQNKKIIERDGYNYINPVLGNLIKPDTAENVEKLKKEWKRALTISPDCKIAQYYLANLERR